MSDGAPCVRCGLILNTGEGRVIVSFVAADLESLIRDTSDPQQQARLLCALGTIDPDREIALRAELAS